jgi:uncharacterized protein YycO
MKTIIKTITIASTVLLSSISCSFKTKPESFKDGDIIFHTSKSQQSKMLKSATGSNLTHVGVIFYKNGLPYVIEAVQPVKVTSLNSFINRGENAKYKVMRYETELTNEDKNKMISWGKKQLGKPYDIKFQWGDNTMYCSELVWKMYKNAGIELCETKKFSDFNLTNEKVRQAIKSRFKNKNEFSLNEVVVAPVDIYNSDKLNLIYSNF